VQSAYRIVVVPRKPDGRPDRADHAGVGQRSGVVGGRRVRRVRRPGAGLGCGLPLAGADVGRGRAIGTVCPRRARSRDRPRRSRLAEPDWIRRATDTNTEPNQYTYARKRSGVGASPIVRARVYVSGDQQYELSVNGVRAGKGEAYSYPDSQYYETLDVTKLLRAGVANAFGLLYSWDGPTKGHPAGAPGAIAQISILHRDGHVETVTTDGSWRVRKGAWMPGTQRDLEGDLVDYTENIDGRAIRSAGTSPASTTNRGHPRRSSVPRSLAVDPSRLRADPHRRRTGARGVVDAPSRSGAIVGRLRQGLRARSDRGVHHGSRAVSSRCARASSSTRPRRGSHQLVGEAGEPGQVSKAHGTQHTDMSYSYIERGGGETFQPFDYLGFRYFQIDDPGETLTTADVVAYTRHTAVTGRTRGDVLVLGSDDQCDLRARRHIVAVHGAGTVHRHADARRRGRGSGTASTTRRPRCPAFGEQNLTRKFPARVRAVASALLPNGAGQQDLSDRTRRARHQRVHRDLPRVGLAVLDAHRRQGACWRRCTRCSNASPGMSSIRSSRRPTSSPTCPRRASTTRSRRSRGSTCWG